MPWMLEPLTVKVTVTLSPARTLPEPEKLAAPEKKSLPAAEAKPEAEAVKPPEWFKDAVRPQRRSRDEVMAYLRGKADGDGR